VWMYLICVHSQCFNTVCVQGPCTYAPFVSFTLFSKKNKFELTKKDIETLFEIQLADGYKLMTATWIAYCEWAVWRATRTLPKGVDDYEL
jgi:hypothetical protein